MKGVWLLKLFVSSAAFYFILILFLSIGAALFNCDTAPFSDFFLLRR